MVLLYPIWLLLLFPLGIALWMWKLPRPLAVLRIMMLICVMLAMCGLAIEWTSGAGTLVVVADRSRSMPTDSDIRHKESIDLLQNGMAREDRLAVISFGQTLAIDRTPQGGKFAGFVNDVGKDASNLTEAIDMGLSLIPSGSTGKLLILSDGKWTGKDPSQVVFKAAARGIGIDYRPMGRMVAQDIAVAHVEMPSQVNPGEYFTITAWVRSPIAQETTVELWRGGQCLAAGKRQLTPGLNSVVFRDKAGEAGTQQYQVRITNTPDDPVPENNIAKLLLGVEGQKAVLCVSDPNSGLVKLLERGGLKVRWSGGNEFRSLADLSQFSAAIIENMPADKITMPGMENLAAWVKDTGSGLMMTGGRSGYGPGGYFRSPLEPVLPVSMELRREHRKLSLAIVVVLDRSGSMTATVAGGKTKMDLANLAAAQVLDMLTPMDELGVIAVDTQAHIIADLQKVSQVQTLRNTILRIESMGGGIYVYTGLVSAAMLLEKAAAGTRHIILFADVADAEEPGNYKELLAKCREAGITVSVIGMGSDKDKDAAFLRDVASRGNGRCLFSEDANELPRLFAQDTFVVARNSFITEPTPVKATSGLFTLTGRQFEPQPVGGYNLCYLRPGATLGVVSQDEYNAPIVASWQIGMGRVLCYTGEADGKYTGPLAQWKDVGEFFLSLARWTVGQPGQVNDMLVTQQTKNGTCVIELHLDPARQEDGFTDLPQVITLTGTPGQKPVTLDNRLQWISPDTLAITLPMDGDKTMLSTVAIPQMGKISLPPVCLPYSPEFKPAENDRGIATLERLARATGGKERLDISAIWKEMPQQQRWIEIQPWLLLAAILLLLLEVLERRTGLLALKWRGLWQEIRRQNAAPGTQDQPQTSRKVSAFRQAMVAASQSFQGSASAKKATKPPATSFQESAPQTTPEPAAPTSAAPAAGGVLDAMRKARQQINERTKNEKS